MEFNSALGKRKRLGKVTRRKEASVVEDSSLNNDSDNQEAFKRYFESRFQPLDLGPARNTSRVEEEEEEEEEEKGEAEENEQGSDVESTSKQEWEGFSDNETVKESTVIVEVIEHSSECDLGAADARRLTDFKSFMSAKIPRDVRADRAKAAEKDQEAEEYEEAETLNLKHDLDLQRLLKESHLLDKANTSLNPGEHRHRATDLRIQSLGSQDSIFQQTKMPIAHRKGIQAKAIAKESRRRKEARENGIILEKASKSSKSSLGGGTKRDRGVDSPAVGRFHAGTLKLSKDDVASIQGRSSHHHHHGGQKRFRGGGRKRR